MVESLRVLGVAALAAAVLAACGGGSGGGSGSGGGGSSQAPAAQVTLAEFSITPNGITARAGSSITVKNMGTVAHDLAISDSSGKTIAKTDLIQPGATGTLQLTNVPAGSYTAFCDVPGHKAQGMVGHLTVQ